jgi:hypothetical protein
MMTFYLKDNVIRFSHVTINLISLQFYRGVS